MIKKLILFLIFMFALPLMAQDSWVYIRTYNRYGVTAEDCKGRSKIGDIVDIRPCDKQNIPSETEKKEWSIIKVSGLTKEDIRNYTEIWGGKAYRKHKFDIKALNLKIGIIEKAKKLSVIKHHLSEKTKLDLISYQKGQRWYALWRPLRIVRSKFIQFAWAEVVSTINKAGEDYNTLTLWEDAKDGDLVTGTRQETAECYDDDGTLDDLININGSTTNDTYYMKITVPSGDRHYGIAGAGFKIDPSSNGIVIAINDDHTVIEWVEITGWTGNYEGINLVGASDCTIGYCLLHDASSSWAGISQSSNTKTGTKIYNCLIYNINNSEGFYLKGAQYGVTHLRVTNCTAYGCVSGFFASSNNYPFVDNCLSYNNTTDFSGNFAGEGDYNFSKDDTAPGGHAIHGTTDGKTPDFVSTTGGSEDFHLQSTSDAIGVGVDNPGSGLYSDDIDGEARVSTWDIGADEYVAAGGASAAQFIMINQ